MKVISKAFLAAAVLASGGLAVSSGSAWAEPIELKIASLAPDGSSWAKTMASGGQRIAEKTNNRVTVKFFFSGTQGDERDVVRKMKLGQIDGAALTAVGLGVIKGDVRVLELPFLFKSDKELDYVRTKMAPDFEKQFGDAGYELLSWGDVGWVHVFTNTPVASVADLDKAKMWAWTDDPIIRTFYKDLGVNGVPLGVPDVLPALQTGKIDGCAGSPLAMVALQWYTKVKYGSETPISYSIGAVVLRKEVFAKLSAEDQRTIREVGVTIGDDLMKKIRLDNERAKKAMVKSGVQFVATPPALVDKLETTAHDVWKELSGGKLYSSELFDRVQKYLAEARKAP
jgi:TRAP-type C4-dicarboxylate transport system substrate-binding protein